MKKIVISGYYGAGNTGDEAILTVLLDHLLKRVGPVDILVVSVNPRTVEAQHCVPAVGYDNVYQVAEAVRAADLVINGGGGVFQDYNEVCIPELFDDPSHGIISYAVTPVLAAVYRVPLLLFAHGVGPISTNEGAYLTHYVTQQATTITVRDQASKDMIEELYSEDSVRPTVTLTGDPSLLLAPASKERLDVLWQAAGFEQLDRPIIGIALRPWFGWPDANDSNQLAKAFDTIIRELDASILFLPFQNGSHDAPIMAKIQCQMEHARQTALLEHPIPPSEMLGLISRLDLVLGMRLHSLIFATMNLVPCMGLGFDPKLRHFLASIGIQSYCLDLNRGFDKSNLLAIVRDLWGSRSQIREHLGQQLFLLRTAAATNFDILNQLLDTRTYKRYKPPRFREAPRIGRNRQPAARQLYQAQAKDFALHSQMKEREQEIAALHSQMKEREQEIAALHSQMKEREQEIAALHSQISEIKSSTAWSLVLLLWRIRLFLLPRKSLRERMARMMMRGFRLWRKEGFRTLAKRLKNKMKQMIFKQGKKVLRSTLPEGIKKFYREFRKRSPFVNKSDVILFADRSVLPQYSRRYTIGDKFGDEPAKFKVSLIATTLNEAQNAKAWLQSLLNQSRLPDEVVIVDGGSKDGTPQIIREFANSSPINIRILESPGANPSKGRNVAIQNANYPIIACTDFGCALDRDWLRLITLPFEVDPSIDLSGGFYQQIIKTSNDRIFSPFFVPNLDAVDPASFLPSSRSLAMKQTFWARVGGYPEWLTLSGEDTLFMLQAKSHPSKQAFVPQAKVYWEGPPSLAKTLRTVFRWAKGDGEATSFADNYWSKSVKAFQLVSLAACGLLLVVLSLIFEPWALLALLAIAGLLALALAPTVLYFLQTLRSQYSVPRRLFIAMIGEAILFSQVLGFTAGVLNRPKVRERQAKQYVGELRQIIADHPIRKGIIVYPATHDWGYMFQRPHQMARTFARRGFLYFYCTENQKTDSVIGFREVEPNLYLCNVPLQTFRIIEKPIVYIGSAWHRNAISCFEHPRIIYDHYDDLEVSSARLEDHKELMRIADVVLVTAKRLLDTAGKSRPDALSVPNGVDYEYIKRSRPSNNEDMPSDWVPIAAKGKPIIGYSGGLAQWLDYELLSQAARERPDLEFVLIGVDYDGSLGKSMILTLPNVHWLGMKNYDELFRYVWRFDVGVIPFKINNITLSTSPIKLFEYFACQKPAVTTALPEVRRYPSVLIAETAQNFVGLLDEALALRYNSAFLESIDKIAQENTWDNRVAEIVRVLFNHTRNMAG